MDHKRSKKLLVALGLLTTLLFSVLLAVCGEANADGLFETQEVSVTYRSFFQGGRDPLINQNGLPDRLLGKEFVVTIDNDVLHYFYWNNNIHSGTDKPIDSAIGPAPQFRTIGLQFSFGARLTPWAEVGYYHHSQHVLDTSYANGFPVEDAFELKLRFVGKASGEALLPW